MPIERIGAIKLTRKGRRTPRCPLLGHTEEPQQRLLPAPRQGHHGLELHGIADDDGPRLVQVPVASCSKEAIGPPKIAPMPFRLVYPAPTL